MMVVAKKRETKSVPRKGVGKAQKTNVFSPYHIAITPPDLGTISTALGVLDSVIALGEKIYHLITPDYEEFAKQMNDLYSKMYQANAKLSEWISNFINFNFSQPDPYGTFLDMYKNFETWRCGEDYAKLSRTYLEIKKIYDKYIHAGLRKLIGKNFTEKEFQEAEKLFDDLTGVNRDMIGFFYSLVIPRLKVAVDKMVSLVDKKKIDDANKLRIELRKVFEEIIKNLEIYADRLRDVGRTYISYVNVVEDLRAIAGRSQIESCYPLRCTTCGSNWIMNPCPKCCTWWDSHCNKYYRFTVGQCLFCGLSRVKSKECK
jgi:hypothetical protein